MHWAGKKTIISRKSLFCATLLDFHQIWHLWGYKSGGYMLPFLSAFSGFKDPKPLISYLSLSRVQKIMCFYYLDVNFVCLSIFISFLQWLGSPKLLFAELKHKICFELLLFSSFFFISISLFSYNAFHSKK